MELVSSAKSIAKKVQEDLTESGKTGEYTISSEQYSQGVVAFVISEIQGLLSLDESSFNKTFLIESDIRQTRIEGTFASQPVDLSKLKIVRL